MCNTKIEKSLELLDESNVGLTHSFCVNPSSCSNSGFYVDYLKYSAFSDQKNGRSKTHLFVDRTNNRIMGFVSLRANALISQNTEGNMCGKPALEITVLAVDQEYTHQQVGTTLIAQAIAEADHLHKNHIGVEYIILVADKMSVEFYEKMGFVKLSDNWEQVPKDFNSVDGVQMAYYLNFELQRESKYTDYDE